MSTVNYTNPNIDLTVRVFDRFYSFDVNVSAAEYDVVFSFFKKLMGNNTAAGNFTASLFKVAQDTNIPVLTLLNELQGQSTNTMNLNVNLAYYLNTIRSRATLLGVGRPVVANFYASRNVIQ